LFGYAEGAFTGAKKAGQPGVFEQANGGTLFLDEISEMPFELQVNLLRVIQEREVTRLGSTKAIPIDVRIVVSTNKLLLDLSTGVCSVMIYTFRLNVLEINVPPLRERKGDLWGLAHFFIKKFSGLWARM